MWQIWIILAGIFMIFEMIIPTDFLIFWVGIGAALTSVCSLFTNNITVQIALLKESIPPSKYKNQIFSKINSKGATGYYVLNMISQIVAGYLFTINGYVPMICTLVILIISTLISTQFIEPNKKAKVNLKETIDMEEIKNIKSGFKFVLKSERLNKKCTYIK